MMSHGCAGHSREKPWRKARSVDASKLLVKLCCCSCRRVNCAWWMCGQKSAANMVLPLRYALSESRSWGVGGKVGGKLHPKLNRCLRQPTSTVKERCKGLCKEREKTTPHKRERVRGRQHQREGGGDRAPFWRCQRSLSLSSVAAFHPSLCGWCCCPPPPVGGGGALSFRKRH